MAASWNELAVNLAYSAEYAASYKARVHFSTSFDLYDLMWLAVCVPELAIEQGYFCHVAGVLVFRIDMKLRSTLFIPLPGISSDS